MTTEPAHLFTDPFGNRGNELKGHTGIIARLAAGLPDRLVALNALHEDVLVPQNDLTPYSAALRAATPRQVEDARHLIIQALDRVAQAMQSRGHSVSQLSKKVRARRFEPSVSDRLLDPTGATDGVEAVMLVADEVRVLAEPALTDFRNHPTRDFCGRMVREMAEAYAEGAIVLRAIAEAAGREDIAAFAEGYARDQANFADRVERFRNGVGEVYAAQIHRTLPSKAEIAAIAHRRAAGFGDCPSIGFNQVQKAIDGLGGSDEGVRAHFGRRMLRFEGTNPDQFHPEPAPLSPKEANRLKLAAADILDAYQGLNHVRGFSGYVRQLVCALETDRLLSAKDLGLAHSLRSVMEGARPALGLEPSQAERRALVFRPVEDDSGVIIGRFSNEEECDCVALLFREDRARNGKSGSLLAFVAPEAVESGIPSEKALHLGEVEVLWSTNFPSSEEALAWLVEKPNHVHMPAWMAVDGIGYVDEPETAVRSLGMRA